MKILMLHNDYLLAGGERVSVATEVDALRESGIDVKLLLTDNSNFQAMGPIGKATTTFPRREAFEAVRQEIDSFRPDVVHAQNLFPQLGPGAIRAVARSKTPWVRTIRNYRKGCIAATFTRDGRSCRDCAGPLRRLPGVLHGCYQDSRVNSLGATNYALWEERSERAYPPSAYILVSEAMRDSIRYKLQPESLIRVVHNAVSRPAADTARLAGDRSFDAAFVGRMANEKGVQTALAVARNNSHLRFAFVGDGPRVEEVESAARDHPNIVHLGGLDANGAARIMADSKVVLVPSAWDEPFGRVAAEALANGAIPVVSDRGGLPEIVNDLPYQAVVTTHDPVEWSTALNDLVHLNDSELERVSLTCRERWILHFSPNSLASKLKSVYEECLSH